MPCKTCCVLTTQTIQTDLPRIDGAFDSIWPLLLEVPGACRLRKGDQRDLDERLASKRYGPLRRALAENKINPRLRKARQFGG